MKLHFFCALPLIACLIVSLKAQRQESPELEVRPEKELLILDPAVVDSRLVDYPGALSIGHLFDELASDGDGARLMRHWLETWGRDVEVNGAKVAARPKVRELLIAPWQRADAWKPGSVEDWRPDLAHAPFRLLAIANRLDLAQAASGGSFYGFGGGGGDLVEAIKPQGRLVYAALGPDGKPLGRHFTVIFEYELPHESAAELQALAGQWHELGGIKFGESYLDKLESLTRSFTDRASDDGRELGASRLAQLRTNDMALAEVCELREFRMDDVLNVLAPAALANTPSMEFARKGSRLNRVLADFIQENQEATKAGSLKFPLALRDPGGNPVPLLVGSALVPHKRFHWDSVRLTDPETRHHFSMRTCNGCHAGDTNTEFCHIGPRLEGEAAKISEFLRMDGSSFKILDPAQRRRQVDSNEMRDRVAAYLRLLDPTMAEQTIGRKTRRARATH